MIHQLYSFDSRHNVMLVDRKGFVRTMNYTFENKILPPGWAALATRIDNKADQWFHLED